VGQGSAEVALDLVQFLLFYPNMTPAEIKAIMQRSMQPFKSNKARRSVGELDIMRML
jgi:subtilisin